MNLEVIQMAGKIVRIEKTYTKKVTNLKTYSSFGFGTTMVKEVEVKTPEELQELCEGLFQNCKMMTEADIEACKEEIEKG